MLKILVAEDDKTLNLLIRTQLKKLGVTVEAVENGLEAANRVSTSAYDIVLLDYWMPHMTGLDSALAIRRGEAERKCANVPIIVMTASAEKMEECLSSGAVQQFMIKPVQIDQLRNILKRWGPEQFECHTPTSGSNAELLGA